MDNLTLGQEAYQAYGDSVGWKNFQGNPMPTWGNLTDAIRTAWEAAAAKVFSEATRPTKSVQEIVELLISLINMVCSSNHVLVEGRLWIGDTIVFFQKGPDTEPFEVRKTESAIDPQ